MPRPNAERPLGKELTNFFPSILPWNVEDKDQPVCVIQLHQFECGGSIFSITNCHTLADGPSLKLRVLALGH